MNQWPPQQQPPNQSELNLAVKVAIITGIFVLAGAIITAIIGPIIVARLSSRSTSAPNPMPTAIQSLVATQMTATMTANNATATAAAVVNPYGGMLVLSDSLSDNSKGNGWNEFTDSNGGCQFVGGAYNVSSPITPRYHACAALNTNFSNFAYEVEMTIIAGDCGAIIFRGDITVKHFYFFRICQNGSYDLLVYAGSGYAVQTLVQCDAPCSNPRIHAGLNQPNGIAVVANNNSIALYVNHEFITRAIDNTYSKGQIGVAADNDNSPTTVVFRSAKVWTL